MYMSNWATLNPKSISKFSRVSGKCTLSMPSAIMHPFMFSCTEYYLQTNTLFIICSLAN